MSETIALFVCLGLIAIFLTYSIMYYMLSVKNREESEGIPSDITQIDTLDDLFKEKEMDSIRSKLASIDQFSISKKVQKIGPLSIKKEEQLSIDEGEQFLQVWNDELHDPTPFSEEQRQMDIELLKTNVTTLEGLDKEHYIKVEEESIDLGKGMFYDSISRKLGKIIKNNKWKETPFIQAEKLEGYAFGVIKRLEHEDFLETIKIMKEVGTFRDIIEIDPHTTLLVFTKKTLRFSLAEKVVLSFIAHNDDTSINALQELTKWKSSYLHQIIDNLEEREIIGKENNLLTASGLITTPERISRYDKIQEIKNVREEKQQKVTQLQLKQQTKMKAEQKEKAQSQKLEQEQKQTALEDARLKAEIEAQRESLKIEDSDTSIDPISPEMIEVQIREEVIQNIQKIFTETEPLTGGVIILQALLYYINQGPYPEMKKIELLEYIDILKDRQIIYEEFSFSSVNIYLFQDLVFDDEMTSLLRHFVTHGEMDMEDVETATDWDTEQAKRVLKRFYDQKILQLNERKHFYLPGLFNTN